jgi:hypothetical protein
MRRITRVRNLRSWIASDHVKFISLLLIANYGLLAVLGHAGLHVLSGAYGACCHHQGASSTGSGHDHGDCCHPANGGSGGRECPFETHRRKQSSSRDFVRWTDAGGPVEASDGPQKHDSRHCRICEWHLKASAACFERAGLTVSRAVTPRDDSPETGASSAFSLSACSRGPPLAAWSSVL